MQEEKTMSKEPDTVQENGQKNLEKSKKTKSGVILFPLCLILGMGIGFFIGDMFGCKKEGCVELKKMDSTTQERLQTVFFTGLRYGEYMYGWAAYTAGYALAISDARKQNGISQEYYEKITQALAVSYVSEKKDFSSFSQEELSLYGKDPDMTEKIDEKISVAGKRWENEFSGRINAVGSTFDEL